MRYLVLFYALLALPPYTAADPSLAALRSYYYAASEDSDAADKFLEAVASINASDPVKYAYKGMAYMMQAKYTFNPYNKWNYFQKGKGILETSVGKAPNNIEIRFLRFCIQTNAPFFLEYSGQLASDKKMILDGWKQLTDNDLKKRIKDYMLNSDELTAAEKNVFL